MLAVAIRKAGDAKLADLELAKILTLDPDHIPARMIRALNAAESRRFAEALRDLNVILNHPGLSGYLRKDPSLFRDFHQATRRFLGNGKVDEARMIARRTLDVAIAIEHPSYMAESHYHLALVYAVLARTDPNYIPPAAKELWWVFRANPLNVSNYAQNSEFDVVRGQLDAELRHRRLIGACRRSDCTRVPGTLDARPTRSSDPT